MVIIIGCWGELKKGECVLVLKAISRISESQTGPQLIEKLATQHAKKVVSDSLEPVDFAIGLVNSVLNLPVGQVKYFEEFKLQKNCEINSAHQKVFGTS